MIEFYTEQLNEKLYKRIIDWYLYDMYDDVTQMREFKDKWLIEIYPSTMAPSDPHFDGQEGVGGVTGMGLIKLYLEDKSTNLVNDFFKATLRKNTVVITHELAHALLIEAGRSEKVPLRHNDTSGHRAGTKLAFSTAEVHDRHAEGRFKTTNLWFWDPPNAHLLMNLKLIDIDDLI